MVHTAVVVTSGSKVDQASKLTLHSAESTAQQIVIGMIRADEIAEIIHIRTSGSTLLIQRDIRGAHGLTNPLVQFSDVNRKVAQGMRAENPDENHQQSADQPESQVLKHQLCFGAGVQIATVAGGELVLVHDVPDGSRNSRDPKQCDLAALLLIHVPQAGRTQAQDEFPVLSRKDSRGNVADRKNVSTTG
jgi:hypothetical protein